MRVALGADLVSGRTAVRCLTVHGDRQAAEARTLGCAGGAGQVHPPRPTGDHHGELLEVWLAAEHA